MIEEFVLRKSDPWRRCHKCGKVKSIYDFERVGGYCTECSDKRRDKLNKYHRDLAQNRRVDVIAHYSKGRNVCTKCGFSDTRALSIDHISGNGVRHLKSIGGNFYLWLQKEGYPDGYQVLCMNCQFIKRYENNELPRRAVYPMKG